MSATLKLRLAGQIVGEHFGPLAQLVATVLLEKGRQTIHDIFVATKLKQKPIREILLALIHHHLVGFVEENVRGRTITHYAIHVENILLRLRFPRFVEFARMSFGTDAEILMTEMIKNGRMTADALLEEAASLRNLRQFAGGKPITPESLKETFSILVHNRLFMRVESAVQRKPIVPLVKGKAVPGKPSARQGPASKPVVSAPPEPAATAAPMIHPLAKKRKQAQDALDADAPSKLKKSVVGPIPATGIPPQATAPATGTGPTPVKPAAVEIVYWKINVIELLKQLRHQEMIKSLEKRFDKETSNAVRGMLLLSGAQEKSKNDPTSTPITFHALVSTMPGDTSKEQILEGVLENMKNDSSGILTKLNDIRRGTFLLNMSRICEMMKQDMIESVIIDKFGLYACRIYRLLRMKKQLERKQISDMAMIPQKETFQLLYTLYHDGFVSMQEIPKSSVREPARTFYCWSVKEADVFSMMKERFYKALFNARSVSAKIMHDNKDFIEKAKPDSLVTAERQKLQKLQRAINATELSSIRMIDTIMLLEDF